MSTISRLCFVAFSLQLLCFLCKYNGNNGHIDSVNHVN